MSGGPYGGGSSLAKYQAAGALHNLAFNDANAAAIAEALGGKGAVVELPNVSRMPPSRSERTAAG